MHKGERGGNIVKYASHEQQLATGSSWNRERAMLRYEIPAGVLAERSIHEVLCFREGVKNIYHYLWYGG